MIWGLLGAALLVGVLIGSVLDVWRFRRRIVRDGGFDSGGTFYRVLPEHECFHDTELSYGPSSWRGPGIERARWP